MEEEYCGLVFWMNLSCASFLHLWNCAGAELYREIQKIRFLAGAPPISPLDAITITLWVFTFRVCLSHSPLAGPSALRISLNSSLIVSAKTAQVLVCCGALLEPYREHCKKFSFPTRTAPEGSRRNYCRQKG